jgi:hypothetical protein
MAKTRPPGGIADAKRPPKTKRFRMLCRYYVTASKIGALAAGDLEFLELNLSFTPQAFINQFFTST